MSANEMYLGDGVYASEDGYHIAVLRTERDGRWEMIALDDEVFQSLLRFVERSRRVRFAMERLVERGPDQPPLVPTYEQALMTTDDTRHNPPPPEPFEGNEGKFSGGGASSQWDNESQSLSDTGASVGGDVGSDVGGDVGSDVGGDVGSDVGGGSSGGE